MEGSYTYSHSSCTKLTQLLEREGWREGEGGWEEHTQIWKEKDMGDRGEMERKAWEVDLI